MKIKTVVNRHHFTEFCCLLLSCILSCIVVLLSAAILPQAFPQAQSAVAASAPPSEIRGVWLTNVSSGVLYMPGGIDRALNQLTALQFNTIYPVVWNRGYTFYPSATAARETGRSQEPWLNRLHLGQDVLKQMAKAAQQRQLRVLPWFEYGFMAPMDSELVYRHPQWLTRRQSGAKTIEASPTEELPNTIVWLNPLHPEVQSFLLSLIKEVVSQYPVAGIQLDDHFGLPVKFGYDRYTVQLYQQDHQGLEPPDDPYDPEWMRWRADKLSEFMKRVFQTVKAANPKAIISLSPNPQGFAYRAYLQDWATWINQGWVEELVLQAYRPDLKSFQAELNHPAVQAAKHLIPVSIGIHTGNGHHPVAFEQIRQQVNLTRDQQFAGVSFFYWESLWGYLTPEAPRQRRAGFQALFRSP